MTALAPNLPRVLITGAAGRLGTYLREGMPDSQWRLRLLDIHEFDDDHEVIVADIRDADAMSEALSDVDAVVHLAGIATEAPIDDILETNIEGTWRVFDAARRAGVSRIVYGSSNHAVGFMPRSDLLRTDIPLRPDTNYGVSKAFGESAARFFVDRYGMQVACLRIGSCDERPHTPRMLSTWLSPGDLVRLVEACLRAPDLEYAVAYGISANTRGWWDLESARALGYEPHDDAEDFANEVLAGGATFDDDDPDNRVVGGRWTRFTGEREQPGP